MSQPPPPALSRGFVLAASGQAYATMASQAARSLKRVCPGVPIDLYTDASADAAAFAAVHPLRKSWFRPKFEALLSSRFDLTIYLDADIHAVADIRDAFQVLARHDVIAAHVQNRNQGFATRVWRKPIPAAFPQVNGGLIGIRRSERTTAFLHAVKAAMETEDLHQDQPVLRELLYDSDLRLGILPAEYNARSQTLWRFGGSNLAAPRILHNTAFRTRMRNEATPVPPWRIYGPFYLRHVAALIAADRTLTPGTRASVPAPNDIGGRLKALFRRR